MKGFFWFFIITTNCYSFSLAQHSERGGYYEFSKGRYFEKIVLNPSGTFSWEMRSEMIKLLVNGNWQTRNDSLILDSYPQKEKMIVWETFRKGKLSKVFNVTDKRRQFLNYTFFAINKYGDTAVMLNQWKRTIVSDSIQCFFIKDSKGLSSSSYCIEGVRSNLFNILFETSRVFENEIWFFDKNNLLPRGMDGALQKYVLQKL